MDKVIELHVQLIDIKQNTNYLVGILQRSRVIEALKSNSKISFNLPMPVSLDTNACYECVVMARQATKDYVYNVYHWMAYSNMIECARSNDVVSVPAPDAPRTLHINATTETITVSWPLESVPKEVGGGLNSFELWLVDTTLQMHVLLKEGIDLSSTEESVALFPEIRDVPCRLCLALRGHSPAGSSLRLLLSSNAHKFAGP